MLICFSSVFQYIFLLTATKNWYYDALILWKHELVADTQILAKIMQELQTTQKGN
jgi:hypothetical protein